MKWDIPWYYADSENCEFFNGQRMFTIQKNVSKKKIGKDFTIIYQLFDRKKIIQLYAFDSSLPFGLFTFHPRQRLQS